MRIQLQLPDVFGRRANAALKQRVRDLTRKNVQLKAENARLEGCREILTALLADTRRDATEAHIALDRQQRTHTELCDALVEELALGVVDGLAGGWALRVADTLADQTGVDLRARIQSRINELSGHHPIPALPPAPTAGDSEDTVEMPRPAQVTP